MLRRRGSESDSIVLAARGGALVESGLHGGEGGEEGGASVVVGPGRRRESGAQGSQGLRWDRGEDGLNLGGGGGGGGGAGALGLAAAAADGDVS